MDAFDILGLEPTAGPRREPLEQRHRDLQRRAAPGQVRDTRASSERRESLSRAVGERGVPGAETIPCKRAEALLARLVGPVPKEGEPTAEPALLMEMMELREALADAARAGICRARWHCASKCGRVEQDASAALGRGALPSLRSEREGPADARRHVVR